MKLSTFRNFFIASSACVLGIFSFTTPASAASWIEVQTPSTQKINGIAYTSAMRVFAVGDKGDVLTSTDGGAVWQKAANVPDDTVYFKAIATEKFSTKIFAVGGLGKIWASFDNGLTWTAQSQNTFEALHSIAAGGSHRLVAVGEFGRIISSIDDGAHWTVQVSATGKTLNRVRYGSSNLLWAVGMEGTIIHSNDGGINWTVQNSGTTENLYDVFFDGNSGFAVGENATILRSFNGGVTWEKITTLPAGLSQYVAFYSIADYSGGAFSAITSVGYIFTTYDAGTTWIQTNYPNKTQLTYTIASYNSLSHLLVGTYKGVISQLTLPVPPSAPTALKGPVANGAVFSNSQPTITWNAADVSESTIAGYEVKIDDNAYRPVGNVLAYTPSFALTNGSHTFSVRAVSLAGATGEAATYSLQIQVVLAPAPVIDVPAPQPPQQPIVVPVNIVVPGIFNGVTAGSLIKLVCPPNAGTNDSCRAVYFVDNAGKRHPFPNAKVYASWYSNFDSVQEVSAQTLASFQLGKNITYRAGGRMIKFLTSSVVYVVTQSSIIRPVASAEVAQALYGTAWNKQIDDVSDVFAGDYSIGAGVSGAADYSASAQQAASGSLLGAF